MTEGSGILAVDKPTGPTSHDIVARARRALHTRRIGHTGTLDPFASGLLLLCFGRATRLAEYLTALPKTYRARMILGERTDTDDSAGEVLERSDGWNSVTTESLQAALQRQQGDLMQVPPQYSAKRIDGERMYDIARRGGTVDLPANAVRVESIVLHSFEPPRVEFEVACSSGTYIRAIARDIGEDLGVGAHLCGLRRTRIGGFDVADAVSADDFDDAEAVQRAVVSPADALGHFPRHVLAPEEEAIVRNGRAVDSEIAATEGPVVILDGQGDLIGIGEWTEGRIQPRKIIA